MQTLGLDFCNITKEDVGLVGSVKNRCVARDAYTYKGGGGRPTHTLDGTSHPPTPLNINFSIIFNVFNICF